METGVCVQDLASTMQMLNLFVLINSPTAKTDKNKKVLFVDLNSSLIDQHMRKLNEIPLEKRMALKLDKMCLIWTPYISYHLMAAANQAQESLKMNDVETQTTNADLHGKSAASSSKQQAAACYDEEFSRIRELSELSKFDLSKESLKVINLLAFKETGRKRGRKRKVDTSNNNDETSRNGDEEEDECSQDVQNNNNNNNNTNYSMIAVATDSILNHTEFNETKNETTLTAAEATTTTAVAAVVGDESDSNHMEEDLSKVAVAPRTSNGKRLKNKLNSVKGGGAPGQNRHG